MVMGNAFCRKVECVLYSTRTGEYVRVIWARVPFAGHSSLSQAIEVLHLGLAFPLDLPLVVGTHVDTVHHFWGEEVTCISAHTGHLLDRGVPATSGHPILVQGECLDFRQQCIRTILGCLSSSTECQQQQYYQRNTQTPHPFPFV